MSRLSRNKSSSDYTAYLIPHIFKIKSSPLPDHWNFIFFFLEREIMSDSESDNEEFTIANDLVVTKYKMAGDIANR